MKNPPQRRHRFGHVAQQPGKLALIGDIHGGNAHLGPAPLEFGYPGADLDRWLAAPDQEQMGSTPLHQPAGDFQAHEPQPAGDEVRGFPTDLKTRCLRQPAATLQPGNPPPASAKRHLIFAVGMAKFGKKPQRFVV